MADAPQNLPAPMVLSFLLCDRLIIDANTGQQSLIGIVTQVQALKFPVASPPLWFFAELASGHGQVPVRFEIVDVNEARPPVIDVEVLMNFPDPRAIVHIGLRLPPLIFPEPGDYRLRMLSRGEFLADRRIVIGAVAPPPS